MRADQSTLVSLGLIAALAVASDEDVISFPAIGEVDVVFPRDDTYAVEAPFPVIFGLQNAPALTTFSGTLNWELNCAYTLSGIGRLYLDFLPSTEPYYFLNTSNAIADADEGDQFQYWRSEEDSCTLKWDFRWTVICEPRSDGSVLLKNNQFQRTGNVSFTLRPGAKTVREAILDYDGCATAGTAIKLEKNHTVGCPILAKDASPKPKPCELDVKKARSSLAAAVVKPTTSLTELPSKTTDTGAGVTGTGTNGASDSTSTGETSGNRSGGDSSGDDDNGAQAVFSLSGLTLFAVLVASIGLPLFL